ncbi:MAG TPA: AAA family ATPase, partial [Burkholderiales bacterium]|nr:AAA family ATPase [Burkholderiales bacterium]
LHAWTAQTLIDPTGPLLGPLIDVPLSPTALSEDQEIVARRLSSAPPTAMQVVPLLGVKDADYAGLASALSAYARGRVARIGPAFQPERQALTALAALAWLRGLDLALPEQWPARHDHHNHKHNDNWFTPVLSIPVRWYMPVSEPSACQIFPAFALEPACRLPALTYDGRCEALRAGLGARAVALEGAIAESARRYRFERRAIERVVRALPREGLTEHALFAACRAEALAEFGHLAQPVASRFTLDELVLPPAQAQQIDEIRQAMNALTVVHYGWGTARAWNEGGLAVLFGGPPGTGKTMTAEAMAVALELPMYRIDLSQVVNKYIGETEKNLKRIFDAAELADCVLFFDEADALFGKRTDVKDAHDRFANIEISYLLERMERFKGLAILATNRKKDLDEAFMRRLRYVVEFPMPGVPERERLWRGVFPDRIDTSDLDFRYLARQFPLSGGHIRSIAFNACLLSASESGAARVAMVTVLIAVKRELDKLNRAAGEELFGVYAPMLKGRVA